MNTPQSFAQGQYQASRLSMLVAPVLPPILFAIAGLQLVSAIGYWLGLMPTNSKASAAILMGMALALCLFAVIIHRSAEQQRIELAGLSVASAATVISAGLCIAAYINELGILVALPYCVLVAVGATPFWLRLHHFALAQVGIFVPPLILLLATNPTAVEWSFSIQISVVTLAASTGMFLLLRKANLHAHDLALELEHRASYDGLTGVLNRSAWIARADRRLLEARQRGQSTSCLFIDLDHLKLINDDLGHGAGDELLEQVAGILGAFASIDRLVGRIGGDEFVMLLPGAGFAEAEEVVGRILTAMRSVQLHDRPTVASIGIASTSGAETLDRLLHRADLAMLSVKERNRMLPGEPADPGVREQLNPATR